MGHDLEQIDIGNLSSGTQGSVSSIAISAKVRADLTAMGFLPHQIDNMILSEKAYEGLKEIKLLEKKFKMPFTKRLKRLIVSVLMDKNTDITNKADSPNLILQSSEDDIERKVDRVEVEAALALIEAELATKASSLDAVKKSHLLDLIYPVGTVYESTANSSPAGLLGGIWESYGAGRVLVGQDAGFAAGATGGAATVNLNINQIPWHNHSVPIVVQNYSGNDHGIWRNSMDAIEYGVSWNENMTSATGGNAAHENMPPYIVVYRWRRTA